MQSLAINLSVLIPMISLASYSGPLFPYINKTPSRQLIFLLIFTHAYYFERNRRRPVNLRVEDLSILKIIKTNASLMWKKYKPGR